MTAKNTKMAPQPMPAQEPVMTEEDARAIAELQRLRDELYQTTARYKTLLNDTTLQMNRSNQQRLIEEQVKKDLVNNNSALQNVNVGEGPTAIAFLALNSILLLRDKVNELRYQNTVMYKELESLKAIVGKATPPEQK